MSYAPLKEYAERLGHELTDLEKIDLGAIPSSSEQATTILAQLFDLQNPDRCTRCAFARRVFAADGVRGLTMSNRSCGRSEHQRAGMLPGISNLASVSKAELERSKMRGPRCRLFARRRPVGTSMPRWRCRSGATPTSGSMMHSNTRCSLQSSEIQWFPFSWRRGMRRATVFKQISTLPAIGTKWRLSAGAQWRISAWLVHIVLASLDCTEMARRLEPTSWRWNRRISHERNAMHCPQSSAMDLCFGSSGHFVSDAHLEIATDMVMATA